MAEERTVWYRKWRPQTFAEISGQEHVTRTLRNAVAGGRTAHAYLLCGPRGTGKTTTARVLAKAVNCQSPRNGEPCDRCESCVAVREGRALDLVEMDAASNRGIDDIRDLRDRVGYAASGGRFKVYLIDEVHELTQQAFDALLKTLEEPPPHVIFVLATTDAHRVPATILSRCQRFDLTRHTPSDIIDRLRVIAAAEGVEIEDEALRIVARAATGALRDAVNMLEQLYASYGRVIGVAQARDGLGLTGDARALDLARLALAGSLAEGLTLIAGVRDDGVDVRQFCREVVSQLRSVLLLRAGVAEAVETDADSLESLRALAAEADVRRITRALKAFGGADFRADPQASLPLELALVEVALGDTAEVAAPSLAEVSAARHTTRPAAAPSPSHRRADRVEPVDRDEMPRASLPTAPEPAQPTPGVGHLSERLAAQKVPVAASPQELTVAANHSDADAAQTTSSGEPEPLPAEAFADVVQSPSSANEPTPSDGRADSADPTAVRPGNGVLTLASARAKYRDIYEAARTINARAVRINPGDIIAVDRDSVTFGLPWPAQVERHVPGTVGHTVLQQAVHEVLGAGFAVHCVHMQGVEDRLRAQPVKPSHLLDEALKLGAKPVSGA